MQNKIRILMVEDARRYHELFATEIRDQLELETEFATSGEEALEKLTTHPDDYGILIIDLNLSGISGETVVKTIRGKTELDRLIVIIMTGSSSPDVESKLLGMGANDFIEKGCAPELFIAKVQASLRTKLALDRLTQLAIDREMFAAGVLHDLKNIETNLMATCELIQMQITQDPIADRAQLFRDVENLKAQVKRMDEYATSIIGQVRSGGRKLQLVPCSLKVMCDWAVSFMGPGLDVRHSGAWIDVVADDVLLKLVVLNVLQNAQKYARPGIKPTVEVSQSVNHHTTVITSFKDNGIGIPEADLRKVFQPFFRSRGAESQQQGFGLGLSMVAKVIEQMGGKVWAETPPDLQGALIKVALPRRP